MIKQEVKIICDCGCECCYMLEYYGKQGKINQNPCSSHTWGYIPVKADGTLDMKDIWIAAGNDWHIINGKTYCHVCAPYNRGDAKLYIQKGVPHNYSHLPQYNPKYDSDL